MSGKLVGCPYNGQWRIRIGGDSTLGASLSNRRHGARLFLHDIFQFWTMGEWLAQRRTCKMTIGLGHHINCHGVELVCCSEGCYGSAFLGQSEIGVVHLSVDHFLSLNHDPIRSIWFELTNIEHGRNQFFVYAESCHWPPQQISCHCGRYLLASKCVRFFASKLSLSTRHMPQAEPAKSSMCTEFIASFREPTCTKNCLFLKEFGNFRHTVFHRLLHVSIYCSNDQDVALRHNIHVSNRSILRSTRTNSVK